MSVLREIDRKLLADIKTGAVYQIRDVLRLHPNVNAQDEYSMTPLMIIADQSKSDWDACQIGEILVEAGADIHLETPNGETALWFAVKSMNYLFVSFLVEKGATLSINKKGIPLIEYAKVRKNEIHQVLTHSQVDEEKKEDCERIITLLQSKEWQNQQYAKQLQAMSHEDFLSLPQRNPNLLHLLCTTAGLLNVVFPLLELRQQKDLYSRIYSQIHPKEKAFLEACITDKWTKSKE